MTDINVGMLSENINNKADRDLNNTNPLTRVVVEVSDKSLMPSWYRVYSDGWCEQGGKFTSNGNVTLTKAYNSIDYNILTTDGQLISTNISNTNGYVVDTNTINLQLSWCNFGYWQASGYIN